jgi:hypothetical protein
MTDSQVKTHYINLYKADWCHNCTDLTPKWDRFKELYNQHKKSIEDEYKIRLFFEEYNDKDPRGKAKIQEDGIEGFPTIRRVIDGEQEEYDGNRTVSDFYKYFISPEKSEISEHFSGDREQKGGSLHGNRNKIYYTDEDKITFADSYKKYMKYKNKCIMSNLISEDDY